MQKFDRDISLEFMVIASHLADNHAVLIAQKELTQEQVLLNLSAMLGMAIHHHSGGDATAFRKHIANVIALSLIAEQFTQPDCNCADCAEKAHIAEQEKAAATNSKFYFSVFVAAGKKYLRVTAAPEQYTQVPAIDWQSITAPDMATAEKNAQVLAKAMGML